MSFCFTCKEVKETVHTDELEHQFCVDCYSQHNIDVAYEFLALTVPFSVGDRVECKTAGICYDGIGIVENVYFDVEHGGSLVYPMFRVRIEEKAHSYAPEIGSYTESCLSLVRVE